MSNTDIFKLLNDAEKVMKSQRESLSDEQKIEFDKKIEESDFKNLTADLKKQFDSLGGQLENILKG